MSEPEQKQLEPTHIAGSTPGVTYRIVTRTDGGYIALRRIGSQSFRVRVERWDHAPLFTKDDHLTAAKIVSLRMNVSLGGARISGVAVGKLSLDRAVGVLTSILVEKTFDENRLELQAEANIDAFETHANTCPGCKAFYGLNSKPETGSENSDLTPAELMSHLPPNGSDPN